MMAKYSDLLADWLRALGYTHCFFVAGGNIMHLLESCSRTMTCVPVVHEVAAGIAAEYFNEVHLAGDGRSKAFALVTAGPGLTNIVTAIAGAYLESRELLVIGGQVKVNDLSRSEVRQRGIQEIDGTTIVQPITVSSSRLEHPVSRDTFSKLVRGGNMARKGPVFLELPLDVQGAHVDASDLTISETALEPVFQAVDESTISDLARKVKESKRPVFLMGSGISRETAGRLQDALGHAGAPVMLTWNAMDRLGADHPMYFGRPNTWGMRYANILLQQADLLVALGTRLSLQQTGFNWQQFLPVGQVIQIDCDAAELQKGHPQIDSGICDDANEYLSRLLEQDLGEHSDWVAFCRDTRDSLPLVETNSTREGFLSPYVFATRLAELCDPEDIVIPCSSGSAFTVMMQTFGQKYGQRIVTNKGLASMGYGLSGAIGAALAGGGAPNRLN